MTLGPLMVDVAGPQLTAEDRELLRHPLVGSVILFTRNYVDVAQLRQLVADIKALRAPALLIGVDHEGGRVQRFRSGFSVLPPAARMGREFDLAPRQGLDLARRMGWLMAAELRVIGIDFSFAPCVDLDYGVSEIIGNRAFHAHSDAVGQLAVATLQGMREAGMAATAKHFPGHGAVKADSHHAIPRDPRSLKRILQEDAAPYQWLGDQVIASVMPAHVIYSKVDAKPAGFSSKWIQEILRRKLRYDGVVFSDDLTMEGAAVAGDILARAQAALQAGCDMALVCNRPDLADELLVRLSHQSEPASVARIARLMPTVPAPDWQGLQQQPAYQKALESVRELHERS